MTTQILVDLSWRTDRQQQEYLVGTLQIPATIDLSKGVVFLIWPNDKGPKMAIRGLESSAEKEQENEERDPEKRNHSR